MKFGGGLAQLLADLSLPVRGAWIEISEVKAL